jgi:DNA gyrase/topoisomerase IV subunit B
MTPLILDGRLYSAQPPLYYAEVGSGKNSKRIYFNDDYELSEYVNKQFCKRNTIQHSNGKKMSPTEISQFVLRNMDYLDMVDHLSRSFAVNPYLLETIVNNYHKGPKALDKAVRAKWRFSSTNTVNGVTVITANIDGKRYVTPVDERFIGSCLPLIELSKLSEQEYVVNGTRMGLFDTVNAFEALKPHDIKRFKGLGEMNADQLAESTVRQESRTLMQYTIEDVKREVNEIRKIESDFSILLKDIRGIKKDDLA